LLDEVLFWGYRKKKIVKPVFVISNPRSGTTLLQGLLAEDQENFITLRLYHTLLSSISGYRFIHLIGQVEKPIGRPLYHFFQWLGRKLFKAWDGIHPIGFDKPEEDEGFWFFSFLSPALSLITPYFQQLRYLNIMDKYPETKKEVLSKFYKNYLQRICYKAKGKRILIKSVMSAGRINMIRDLFPDVRFIFLDRDPIKTIPSYISMFSVPWRYHSPEAGILEYQSIGQTAIDFHNYLKAVRATLPKNQFLEIQYESIIKDPLGNIKNVYSFLEEDFSKTQRSKVKKRIEQRKTYKSKHNYNLEMYGYTEEIILKGIKNT